MEQILQFCQNWRLYFFNELDRTIRVRTQGDTSCTNDILFWVKLKTVGAVANTSFPHHMLCTRADFWVYICHPSTCKAEVIAHLQMKKHKWRSPAQDQSGSVIFDLHSACWSPKPDSHTASRCPGLSPDLQEDPCCVPGLIFVPCSLASFMCHKAPSTSENITSSKCHALGLEANRHSRGNLGPQGPQAKCSPAFDNKKICFEFQLFQHLNSPSQFTGLSCRGAWWLLEKTYTSSPGRKGTQLISTNTSSFFSSPIRDVAEDQVRENETHT